MPRKKRVKKEVLPVPPALLDTEIPSLETLENNGETPTPIEVEVEEDPRYTLLKTSLKDLLGVSPAFDKVKANPWLYLEWRNQIRGLVQ